MKLFRPFLLLATILPASAQLPLQQDDTVCLIGNALADRMQHDGWVETILQSQLAGKQIVKTIVVPGRMVNFVIK